MRKIKLVRNSNDNVIASYLSGDLPDEIFADYIEERGVSDDYRLDYSPYKLLKTLRTAIDIQFSKSGRQEIVDQLKKDGYI